MNSSAGSTKVIASAMRSRSAASAITQAETRITTRAPRRSPPRTDPPAPAAARAIRRCAGPRPRLPRRNPWCRGPRAGAASGTSGARRRARPPARRAARRRLPPGASFSTNSIRSLRPQSRSDQLRGRADAGEHPADQHADLVGQRLGQREIMGHEQDRRPRLAQGRDHRGDMGAAFGVEAGGRLVQDQQFGRVHQRGGYVRAALIAAREPRDRRRRHALAAGELQHRPEPRLAGPARKA